MFSFLDRKQHVSTSSGALLQVDIHSHLIAGIDDGAQSFEESLQLIRALQELGYRKAITTPHVIKGVYDNSEEKISDGLRLLLQELQSNKMSFEVRAAAEYYFDEFLPEKILHHSLLTFGNKYVLFELNMNVRPQKLEELVFNLNTEGYKPVLAHPERYMYYHNKKLAEYEKLKDYGVYFQLNISSLTGYYTKPVRKIAQALIDANMIEFAGSDIHRLKQAEVLESAFSDKHFQKLLASGKLLNHTL